MRVTLSELMDQSGVRFGTSGARGLATALTDQVAYLYTQGFLQYLAASGDFPNSHSQVAVAGDLRPSTTRLMEGICRAIESMGHQPIACGRIPSPAVALYGLNHRIPSIMVTGSHIPADRNGIKFNRPQGEILKRDEAGIAAQSVEWEAGLFDEQGAFTSRTTCPRPIQDRAAREYLARYLNFFPSDALQGTQLGLYQHSAVGRDLIHDLLVQLGAHLIPLARSQDFVPVDTEAIRPEDVDSALHWASEFELDAIVSTDGDSDRPLISDESGRWLRGDIAGVLCARYLAADSVSVPVSCNTAVERSGWFPDVRRTRIGSPYVIESMQEAAAAGAKRVVGYEANGGFLIQTELQDHGRVLPALPTRDAVICILGVLMLARRETKSLRQLLQVLPPRFTASDRLQSFPAEKSRELLAMFNTGDDQDDMHAVERLWKQELGAARSLDRTDGLRITFVNGDVLHLRPSGNAPEFRCYTEAATEERALELNQRCLEILRRWS